MNKSIEEKDIDNNILWCLNIFSTDDIDNVIVKLENEDKKEIIELIKGKRPIRYKEFNNLMEKTANGDINLNFINNLRDYIEINNKCLCKNFIYNFDKENKLNTIFYMKGELDKGKTGIAYPVCFNDKCPFILKKTPMNDFKSYLSIRLVETKDDNYNVWKFDDNKYKYITAGSSGFINQTCLHMAINEIMKFNENYVYQYDAFICKEDKNYIGYNITEFSTEGDLSKFLNKKGLQITDEFIIDIIKQILTPLFSLKQEAYQFNHADLKTKNIFVGKNKEKYIYRLADFDKSSIFWKGIRFYNNDYDYEQYLPDFSKVITDLGNIYMFKNTTYSTKIMQVNSMHSKYPFFKSYDIYTFMFSLMCETPIYNFYKKNPLSRFATIWNSIWVDYQLSNIQKIFDNIHTEYNIPYNDRIRLEFIKEQLSFNELRLKKDLNFLLDDLDIIIPPTITKTSDRKSIILKESKNNHLCISKCIKTKGYLTTSKSCNTNTYKTANLKYNWDYC